jgi:AcrR family transcriptional regulator
MSLARIAQRLKFTPNALYRYVESRDELHVLARERALGFPPELDGTSWRTNVTAWADALLARYAQHPWLLDLAVRLPIGPSTLSWLECLLEALEPLELDAATRLRIATLVDGYVRSCAVLMRDLAGGGDVLDPSVGVFLASRIADRGMARVSALMTSGAFAPAGDSIDDDYRFGLGCILDGIAARVES